MALLNWFFFWLEKWLKTQPLDESVNVEGVLGPVLDNVTSIKYLSKTDSRIRNKGRTLRRKELVDCVRGLG
jgi:hypothetical protein